MKKFIFILGFITYSCTHTPKPIAYGSTACHYCKMTIVDKQHAAQLMTVKGRSYAFDASECLLNHLNDIDQETVAVFLVNDYENPGELIDATAATYLISENIPSPMGAFLSAFSSKEGAVKAKTENGGELYTWKELQQQFRK